MYPSVCFNMTKKVKENLILLFKYAFLTKTMVAGGQMVMSGGKLQQTVILVEMERVMTWSCAGHMVILEKARVQNHTAVFKIR